jgi:hypothetical protein
VESWWEPFNPAPIALNIREWFDTHFIRVSSQAFDGIRVYLYVPNPQVSIQTGAN